MYSWGDNDHGQQGNGTTTVNLKPYIIDGLDDVKKVACGSSHRSVRTLVVVVVNMLFYLRFVLKAKVGITEKLT